MQPKSMTSSGKKTQATTSILSLVLSILASSHHWIHMTVLMLMGSSAGMAAMMSHLAWLRRLFIIASVVMVVVSVVHLSRHGSKGKWMIIMVSLSAVISLGLVGYTVYAYGW